MSLYYNPKPSHIMISKSGESLQFPTLTKPISAIKQIPNLKNPHNSEQTCFMMACMDGQLVFLAVRHGKGLACRHALVQLEVRIVALFWDGGCYCGGSYGEVVRVRVQGDFGRAEVEAAYQEARGSADKCIILLYTIQQYLITWNLSNEVAIHSKKTLQKLQAYQFSAQITCGMSFLSRQTHHIIGCIAFNTGHPPIIFPCHKLAQFPQIFQSSLSIYMESQLSQPEIVTMSDRPETSTKQTLILCGTHCQKSKANFIVVYRLQEREGEEEGIFYLEPVYKIRVRDFVMFLDVKDGVGMASLFTGLLFFNVFNRSRELMIERKDLEVTVGFILGKGKGSIKFMVYKGFNYMEPNRYTESIVKLRIRDRNTQKQKPH